MTSYEHSLLWIRYSPEGGVTSFGINYFGGVHGTGQESLYGQDINKIIARLGNEGWEIVSAVGWMGSTMDIWFKRPIN